MLTKSLDQVFSDLMFYFRVQVDLNIFHQQYLNPYYGLSAFYLFIFVAELIKHDLKLH